MPDTKGSKFKTPGHECPQCHSNELVVPIYYGLFQETPEEVKAGHGVLGGCCLRQENFYCKRCGLSFFKGKD